MAIAPQLEEILKHSGTPCVSLYQPIYRSPPEQVQNAIRYENLVKQAEISLRDQHGNRTADEFMARFSELAQDPGFFKPRSDGLAIFTSPQFMRVFRLPRPVMERVQVSNSFLLKPLIRILQTADRFQVLGVSAAGVRILEGSRDTLIELDPDDGVPRTPMEALPEEYTDPSLPPGVDPRSRQGFGGPVIHAAPRSRVDALDTDIERFFRVVNRAVTHHHSRRTGLPLILAALPQHLAAFRQLNENPFLLSEAIQADPFALSTDELRQRVWELLEPRYAARLQQLGEAFHAAKNNQKASDDLIELAKAAAASRIRVLLLAESQHAPGRIDVVTGDVGLNPDEHDDVYDSLAELVLQRGGEVVVAASDRMPTTSGVAGIYRF